MCLFNGLGLLSWICCFWFALSGLLDQVCWIRIINVGLLRLVCLVCLLGQLQLYWFGFVRFGLLGVVYREVIPRWGLLSGSFLVSVSVSSVISMKYQYGYLYFFISRHQFWYNSSRGIVIGKNHFSGQFL